MKAKVAIHAIRENLVIVKILRIVSGNLTNLVRTFFQETIFDVLKTGVDENVYVNFRAVQPDFVQIELDIVPFDQFLQILHIEISTIENLGHQ